MSIDLNKLREMEPDDYRAWLHALGDTAPEQVLAMMVRSYLVAVDKLREVAQLELDEGGHRDVLAEQMRVVMSKWQLVITAALAVEAAGR